MYKIIYNVLIRSPKMERVLTYSDLTNAIEVAREYAKELHAKDSVAVPICYIIDECMGDTSNDNIIIWYYEKGNNLVKLMRSRLIE